MIYHKLRLSRRRFLQRLNKCCFTPGSLETEDNASLLAAAIDPKYHQLKLLSDIQHSIIHDAENWNDALTRWDWGQRASFQKEETRDCPFFPPCEDEDTRGKEEEIERFLREPTLNSDASSLEWWSKNAEWFTTLARMARKISCNPATSVPEEG